MSADLLRIGDHSRQTLRHASEKNVKAEEPCQPLNQGNADLFGVSRGARKHRHFRPLKWLKIKEPGNRIFRFRLIFGQDGQKISVSLGKR
jgi:hypothetical protein